MKVRYYRSVTTQIDEQIMYKDAYEKVYIVYSY